MLRAHRLIAATVLLLGLTACASAPVQPAVATFTDIPVPEGMSYLPDRSGFAEGPKFRVARLLYRGRLEVESLSASIRQGLESNGWKHLRTIKTANRTITQVFEKPDSDLQLALWESTWYTYLDITVGRINQAR